MSTEYLIACEESRKEVDNSLIKFVSGQYCFNCGIESVQRITPSCSPNNQFLLICHSCGSKFDIY